ncbi:hypothetical protein C2S53_003164 [Perilla frutescens var. hirtella]|uniref:RING-type E3 ubiquitin transferase n=1 Tax=Perilla frutescens var. hirtella TaxID=608512 RepID=A0AAD4JKH9_PERFH|nr:hypothetical protein C2S53_003164 [Perilla frutescens var. hirtella]
MYYSWLRSCFFLFACIRTVHGFSLSSSSEITVSYTKHCSSIVPEYETTILTNGNSLPSLSTSYFTGGDSFLRTEPGRTYYYMQKNLRLRIRPDYYQTNTSGIYKVGGFLIIRFPYSSDDSPGNYSYGRRNRGRGSIKFSMNGFWSEESRKLCMLGSASWKGIDRDGILKLKFGDESPTIYSGVVSGSFECTASSSNDRSYFDPILIFSFPAVPNYKYSLVPTAFSSDSDARKDESLSVGANEFCSVIGWGVRNLELQYATDQCTGCSPIHGYFPRFLSLTSIQCPEGERKARFLVTFQNYTSYNGYDDFDVGSSLIGEASWDDRNMRLIGVACEILNPSQHFGNVVRNCTTRLSLRFPSVLNIINDTKIAGQLWSSKSVDDSGYFDKISLNGNDEYGVVALPVLRYEYTELDRVKKLCPSKKPAKKGNVYPDEHSYDMKFDMNIKNKQGQLLGWAYARPSWVGNDSYRDGGDMLIALAPVGEESYAELMPILERERSNNTWPAKMSYKIRMEPYYHGNSSNVSSPSLNWSMSPYHGVEMTAEGMYDASNGFLCMVGCRKLVQNLSTFKDCEVIVELEFPPLKGRRGDRLIQGKIRSTRATNDALHFDDLIVQSAAHYFEEAERSIWRMDFEITMVLVSNTFACIFVGLQIFHVKRNPEIPSFISLVMLVILCAGHMIPLVLNFEAVLLGKHDKKTLELGSGGRLEANEVAVRVITMVALMLQLRLLQLVWTAKQSDSNGKSSWSGEKKAGFVSLSLYMIGGMLGLVLNWIRKRDSSCVWGDLRSYGGLILDGFLVPQIILNIFRGSAEKALSHPFYIGTSAVRLLPHAYNQYRAHNYPNYDLNATYYYANPAADFYSTAWDIIIPFGIVVLVVIVFLQQRLGGHCVLPQRLRGLEIYEKVPTAVDDN